VCSRENTTVANTLSAAADVAGDAMYFNKQTSIPLAVRLSWLENAYPRPLSRRIILTHKLDQTYLNFAMLLGVISVYVHARLQVFVCSGCDLFHPR